LIIGYIFDLDPCISDMNIDKLRSWPSNDEIDDAIRIAHENANAFTKLLYMCKQLKNSCNTVIIPETDDNNQLENEQMPSQIQTIDQAADELNRISQLDDNLDNYFHNILDDLNSKLNDERDEPNSLEINTAEVKSFIKKTEINYIIENPESNILQGLEKDNEEKIFRNDGSCDISLLRKSHEAFSRSDRSRGIRNQIVIQESRDRIDRNLANHLVNQLSDNPQSHQIIRRTQRWKGRNQLQSLVILVKQTVNI